MQRRPWNSGGLKIIPFIEAIVAAYRKEVAFIQADVVMYTEIAKSVQFLRDVPLDIPDALIEGI